MKRARTLQQEAPFQEALKRTVEARRLSMEPAHLAVCEALRDDPSQPGKVRLKAIEVARGPKPAAGVQVNVLQQNSGHPQPAGYVIQLTPRDKEPAIEAKTVINASPRSNAADIAADVEAERADAARFRPR